MSLLPLILAVFASAAVRLTPAPGPVAVGTPAAPLDAAAMRPASALLPIATNLPPAVVPLPTAAPAVGAAAEPAAPALAGRLLPGFEPPSAPELRRSPAEGLKERSLAFFARAPRPAVAAEPAPVDPPEDDTKALKTLRRQVRSGRGKLPKAAARHEYLLVPGLLWDVVDGYFDPNLKRLESLGLKARIVETDPLGGSEANAARLAAAVRRAEKPVVILGHSRGALEAFAMLEREPALAEKVAKIVAIQAPYFGARIADWVLWRGWLRDAALATARLVLSPSKVLKTFPLFRQEALAPIAKGARSDVPYRRPVPASVGLFSVATRLGGETKAPWASRLARGLLKAVSGNDSDGLVEAADQVVPGSRYALLDHVSHLDTVAAPSGVQHFSFAARRHDAKFAADLTEAIVRWVFRRP